MAALSDPELLIRGHSAWALGEILGKAGVPGVREVEVAEALKSRLHVETDPWVKEELERAIRGLSLPADP